MENKRKTLILGQRVQERIDTESIYDPNIDPSVSNSFATAAMRAVKSMSDGTPILYDENRWDIKIHNFCLGTSGIF